MRGGIHFPSLGLHFLMRGWRELVALSTTSNHLLSAPFDERERPGCRCFLAQHPFGQERRRVAGGEEERTGEVTAHSAGLTSSGDANRLPQALDDDSEVRAGPGCERRLCRGV